MVAIQTAFGHASKALMILSGPVMFTKLSPHNLEASTFALYSGIFYFSTEFIRDLLGSFIAAKLNITNATIMNYYQLTYISLGFTLLSFLYVFIVPKREDVDKLAKHFRREHKNAVKAYQISVSAKSNIV